MINDVQSVVNINPAIGSNTYFGLLIVAKMEIICQIFFFCNLNSLFVVESKM